MRKPHGVPASTTTRLHIANANASMVAVTLGRAVDAGVHPDDLVALLLDTRDSIARDLVYASRVADPPWPICGPSR